MHSTALRFALTMAAALIAAGSISPVRADDPPKVVRERWRSLFVGGTQMGYVHETVRLKTVDGKNIVLGENVVVLEVGPKRRPGRTNIPAVRSTVTIQTEETEDGQLLGYRYENRNPAPLPSTLNTGRMENGVMKTDSAVGRRAIGRDIPWKADIKGPVFADKLFIDTPLKADETRSIVTFDPKSGQIDTVKFTAGKMETTLMPDGTEKPLLHVVGTHSIAPDIEFHEFLDAAGESWKTTVPSADMVVYTVGKEAALKLFPDVTP